MPWNRTGISTSRAKASGLDALGCRVGRITITSMALAGRRSGAGAVGLAKGAGTNDGSSLSTVIAFM